MAHPGTPTPAAAECHGAWGVLWRSTIRRKIVLAFLCMSSLTGGLGAYAVTGLVSIGQLTEQTFDGALMSISYARAASADFAGIEAAIARLAHPTTTLNRADLRTTIMDLSQSLIDDLAIAGERALSPRAAEAASEAITAFAAWRATTEAGVTTSGARQADALAGMVHERLELLVNHATGDGFRFRQCARAKVTKARSLALAGTGAAVILGLLIAVVLTRRIIGPVAAASAAAGRIAAGQLDTPIPAAGTDELGALLSAMTTMRNSIAAMVAREVAQRRSAQACLTDAIEGSGEGVMVVDAHGSMALANTRMGEYFPALHGAMHADFATIAGSAPALGALLAGKDIAGETCLPGGTWLRISRSRMREGGFVAI